MSAEYEKTLRRRTALWRIAGVLGIVLICLCYVVRGLNPGRYQTGDLSFAWDTFSCMCLGIVVLSFAQVIAFRRALRRGRAAEIEETDERTRQINALAWTAAGKLAFAALYGGMLASLVLVQPAAFWTCFALFAVLGISQCGFRKWYSSRL